METSLNGAMIVWFTLTALSLVFVIWDSLFNGVTSWVQRVAWILVTGYAGPIGAFAYLLACRRPLPGMHDAYTAATWKQSVNSEMHCLAGDATGIVIAASIVPVLSLPNGWDVVIEYLGGFFVGLFVFQALMMIGMYQGNYWLAVRKTFFAETVSMNLVMTGMIPTMVILTKMWPGSDSPLDPSFWFRMGVASIVGGVVAFPINYWLVANHLKHGCMTLPGADGPAPGLGHRSPEPGVGPSVGMQTTAAPHETSQMPNAEGSQTVGPSHMSSGGVAHTGHAHSMEMKSLSTAASIAWIVATYVLLIAAIWLTSQVVPIQF